MLKALVFDLDDTLLDTSELLIPIAHSPKFLERLIKPLPLMPGALENLKYLKTKYALFLLTFGQPEIQHRKIESLQIAKFFEAVFVASPESGETKAEYFKKIAQKFDNPNVIMSIGNRRTSDIRMAKIEGLNTCLFDYGEHQEERALRAEDYPDFTVTNHFELVRKCRL